MLEAVAASILDRGTDVRAPETASTDEKVLRLYFPHLVAFSKKYQIETTKLVKRWNKIMERLQSDKVTRTPLQRFIVASLELHDELES